jgi:hypothetical protein
MYSTFHLIALTFPKRENFDDNDVDDGVTYAFVVQDKKLVEKIKIHGNAGPKRFWYFGEVLEKIKLNLQFSKTNKKIDLKEINKMAISEVPFVSSTDSLQ